MPDGGWTPVLPFDTDDPSFARGFAAGRVWGLLKLRNDAFVPEIHASNAEMVLRMADAAERTVTAEIVNDDWMRLEVAGR